MLAAERLHEDSAFRVVTVRVDCIADLGAHLAPVTYGRTQGALFSEAQAAVERNPAHRFRLHEVPWLAAHLPHTCIRLTPSFGCKVDDTRQEAPVVIVRRVATSIPEPREIEKFAVDVVLLLTRRAVADADGPSVAIPVEVQLESPSASAPHRGRT